jgi:hypothetical protein
VTEFDQYATSAGGSPGDELDQVLRTTLRTLSDQARHTRPPAPAGQIRSLGTRRRNRRMITSAALAATAVVAAITVSVGGRPGALLDPDPVPPAAAGQLASTADGPDPFADPANDVGYLSGVETSGGLLVVIFDRIALKDQQIINKNPKLRAFTVQDGALVGFTPGQLSDRVMTSVMLLGHGPLVTLVHRGDADGVVVRLQELPTPTSTSTTTATSNPTN